MRIYGREEEVTHGKLSNNNLAKGNGRTLTVPNKV